MTTNEINQIRAAYAALAKENLLLKKQNIEWGTFFQELMEAITSIASLRNANGTWNFWNIPQVLKEIKDVITIILRRDDKLMTQKAMNTNVDFNINTDINSILDKAINKAPSTDDLPKMSIEAVTPKPTTRRRSRTRNNKPDGTK